MVGYRHFSRIEKLYLLIEKKTVVQSGNSFETISIRSFEITEFAYFSSTGITIHLIEWMIFFTRLGLLIEPCSIEDLYFVSLVFVGYMYDASHRNDDIS